MASYRHSKSAGCQPVQRDKGSKQTDRQTGIIITVACPNLRNGRRQQKQVLPKFH